MFEVRSSERRTIPAGFDIELARVRAAHPHGLGPPVRAAVHLTRAYTGLDPDAVDPFGRRRHLAAAVRLAAMAAYAAASVHGAFADRPGLDQAVPRAAADARARAQSSALGCSHALGAVATTALAVAVPGEDEDEDEDWQLSAIAYIDEAVLRDFYEACVTLAASALRVAAAG